MYFFQPKVQDKMWISHWLPLVVFFISYITENHHGECMSHFISALSYAAGEPTPPPVDAQDPQG